MICNFATGILISKSLILDIIRMDLMIILLLVFVALAVVLFHKFYIKKRIKECSFCKTPISKETIKCPYCQKQLS